MTSLNHFVMVINDNEDGRSKDLRQTSEPGQNQPGEEPQVSRAGVVETD